MWQGASAPSPRLPSGRLRPSSTGYGEGRGEGASPQAQTRGEAPSPRIRATSAQIPTSPRKRGEVRAEATCDSPTPHAGEGAGAAVKDANTILEVENLNAWYGAAQVLFDLTLQVGRGEAVALMGRNGAGKSTTIKA